MQLAKVIGNLVATVKHQSYDSHKIMVLQPLNQDLTQKKGKTIIALDTVQSGPGDIVIVIGEGGSTRQVLNQDGAPIRNSIVGIVDKVNMNVS